MSEAVVAEGYKSATETRRLWFRSPLERKNCYLLIFSFLRSGIKAFPGRILEASRVEWGDSKPCFGFQNF